MSPARQWLKQRLASGSTVWFAGAQDALSARLVDQSGFDGVFTTGFGISAALLGQPDMELYTLSENLGVVDHIANVVLRDRRDIEGIIDGQRFGAGRLVRRFQPVHR